MPPRCSKKRGSSWVSPAPLRQSRRTKKTKPSTTEAVSLDDSEADSSGSEDHLGPNTESQATPQTMPPLSPPSAPKGLSVAAEMELVRLQAMKDDARHKKKKHALEKEMISQRREKPVAIKDDSEELGKSTTAQL